MLKYYYNYAAMFVEECIKINPKPLQKIRAENSNINS